MQEKEAAGLSGKTFFKEEESDGFVGEIFVK